jgi:hypothetical protein
MGVWLVVAAFTTTVASSIAVPPSSSVTVKRKIYVPTTMSVTVNVAVLAFVSVAATGPNIFAHE